MYSEILHAFDSTSAPFMYAINLLLAYALTIIVERSYHYYFFWPELLPYLKIKNQDTKNTITENIDEIELSKHPIYPLLQVTSKEINSDEYWKHVSQQAPLIELAVKKRLSQLANIANIATMLGLLGTVYGLVYALGGLDEASLTERTARLSTGISADDRARQMNRMGFAGGGLVGRMKNAGANVLGKAKAQLSKLQKPRVDHIHPPADPVSKAGAAQVAQSSSDAAGVSMTPASGIPNFDASLMRSQSKIRTLGVSV